MSGGERKDLDDALEPAIEVADRGFLVDGTFRQQTLDNENPLPGVHLHEQALPPRRRRSRRRKRLSRTRTLRQPYRLLADKGTRAFYHGQLAKEIASRPSRRRPRPATTKLPVPGRPPDHGGPCRLPRPGPGAHARGVPRPGRLRHGALQQRRHHGRRVTEHPGHFQPFRDVHARAPCTITSRPAHSPSRTAASTWATPHLLTSPPTPSPTRCSARNARARLTRSSAAVKPVAPETWPRTTACARPPPRRPPTRRTRRTSRRPT